MDSISFAGNKFGTISFDGNNFGSQVGINNGTIHLPPKRPETPPPPLSTVPFHRDPDFIDRGSLLDQIQEKASTQGARIALIGLGGVGKSQLAIEYCHRVRHRSPDTWVLWIHASNANRFEQSCREIADRAKIPGRQDPQANIFMLVHNWLNDAKTGKWVIVLDNLDDDKFLHAMSSTHYSLANNNSYASERSVWSYFSQNLTGSVVITSRSRQVALRTVEDHDIIPVEPMNKPHAISLFERKVGALHDRPAIIQLAAALEYMPLAIVQAAAFIKQRAPRESVAQYLERFQKSDDQKINLLDYEGGQLRRDPDAKNAILVTWQISFEDIQERRPSAAGLLSLMSFFDRQGIPSSLLQEGQATKEKNKESGTSDTEDEKSVYSDIDNFENDVLLLRDYSLISITSDPANFEMHRLVQLAMQKWLQAQDSLEDWKELFIGRLESHFPEGIFENWKECQLLFPHVQCTMTQQPVEKSSMEKWASLLCKAASFAWTRGNFVDSGKMAKKAMQTRTDLFGARNEKTLRSSNMLGLAYILGGEWKKAEELQVQVMETSKEVLGPEHPNTLTSMANLASTYRNQGRWKEAEELEVQVMETCKEVLGPEHPDTLTSMANLASTYWNQGRWKEAEELQSEELKLCSKALGPEHSSTTTSMGNLASTYRNQGRWKEAEELEVQVMETCKEVLGPEHPDTLTSMANLASTYWNQGRWKEAEELEVQVMETRKEVLGPEHPETLTSMNNLAFTLRSLRKREAALQMMAKCAESLSQTLGQNHPHTLSSMTTWTKWHSSDEPSPFVSAEPQIITSLKRKTEVTTGASYIGGVSKRQILLSLLTLALGFVYVLIKG
ncbi:P-loop containing nucleoside triphosphate hydrolase protein [Penicillium malachiteum]|uniref:P-loop containing nucleoside triphosphate hydrolase protein n=1 Tax=Penicillium malachiteum TaxID=1324776 RepID=A0AAD6HQR4_9EURO|nr:P-loop containing nucleoside triphosphate hydrolase protein [Penicillium malachiteum]